MYDPVSVVEVGEAFEYSMCNLGDDLDIDWADTFINSIEGALVHELHADANVRIGQKRAEERDDVFRVTVVHDLQLPQDLLANRRLRVNEDDLSPGPVSVGTPSEAEGENREEARQQDAQDVPS